MRIRVAPCLVVLLLVSACGPTPAAPTASVPQTASPVGATPSPSFTPTAPTASAAQIREFPPANCCRGAELDEATYRIPARLGIDVSIEVPPGWRVIREDQASIMALVRGTNRLGDVSDWVAFFVLEEDEPADRFQQAVLDMATFTVTAEPTDVTVAGFDGWRVDLQALPNPGYDGVPDAGIPPESQVVTAIQDYFVSGFNWTTATPEARVTMFCLDIDGRDVVIYVEAPNDGFEASLQDVQSILDSLQPVS